MSFLGLGSQPKVIPEFAGLQVNTAVQALPIPILYGSPRTSNNLVYYNGFQAKQVSTGGGGKGILSGGKGGGKQVQYTATIILALGEGELGAIQVIYQDQGVYTTGDYPSPGLNYFTGAPGQAPWSFVATTWPVDARAYPNTAYLAVANAVLDSSATVPQINMVVQGLFNGTCPLNNSVITISSGQYDSNGSPISYLGDISLGYADADPASVIFDFLVNPRYGAGFPYYLIDAGGANGTPGTFAATSNSLFSTLASLDSGVGDESLQTYCQAVGFGWSMAVNNVQAAHSLLDRWLTNLVAVPVWTGELLKFFPYWDEYCGANPGWGASNPYGIGLKYYNPNHTPIQIFTLDHLLQAENEDEDPITFARSDPMLVYNTVRVDFSDRTNFFNDNVAEDKDEAQIELYGPRVDNIGLADEFTLATYAQTSATLQLRRKVAIRRTFTFRLGPLWGFLDPMDLIEIPDPADWSLTVAVKIISCEDDENEITTYTAEEYNLGATSPTITPANPTTTPNQGATNIPPGPAFEPLIFEPTSAMLTATGFASPQVILGASGGRNGAFDGLWGGCTVWISLDDVNYEVLGSLSGPSALGTLAQGLQAYGSANPDVTNTLKVNMAESGIALPSYDALTASLGKSLCVVKDASKFELLSYTTSILTAPNTFDLTGLYRGLYSTSGYAFGAGSLFLFMGFQTFLETSLPAQYQGHTFWIKLQSFNTFALGEEDIATVKAYQYISTGPVPGTPQVWTARPRRPSLVRPSRTARIVRR